MWSPSSGEMLALSAAGLVLVGLFMLGVIISLLGPVLRDEPSAGPWTRVRRFLPRLTRYALVGTGVAVVFLALAIAGGTVVGGKPGARPGDSTSTIPAQAIAVDAPGKGIPAVTRQDGRWMSGDMHTHTFLTEGTFTQAEVASKALGVYGLDWLANSEHGGMGTWDPSGRPIAETPRWWEIMYWSWPAIRDLRPQYPGRMLTQGVEWNVPKHGHASVGFAYDDPTVVGEFEYRFDAKSKSTSFPGSPPKDNETVRSAANAIAWLQASYGKRSYVVLNHPSRWLNYNGGDIRDFIEAGPDVVTGFEGLPGHQKQAVRGGYLRSDPLGRTYQGADYWLAQVGGMWDSVLGNGYRFQVFSDSDFHGTGDDFWPGEYNKNWLFVQRDNDAQAILDGMKSGRSFVSLGDLVDGLRFSAQSNGRMTDMSRDALVVNRGDDVIVTIKFHAPAKNSHGDAPRVDHLDIISGSVTGPAAKNTSSWEASTNPTTRVVATVDAGTFQDLGDGWRAVTYLVPSVQGPLYLRLRATNTPRNTPGMTDAAGNPLMDVPNANTEDRAWKTLWFYSNPVWIDVRG